MAGTKTRDQFITEICDVCGKSSNASAVSGTVLQTRVIDYLNWAQERIARAYSFHELNDIITTAATVTSVKTYPMVTGTNNLGLTRPKDIHSIRLIDSENSINLERWLYRKLDKHIPRPENYSTGRPTIYTRWGSNLEFYRIPDAVYTLWIRYSKWATPFTTGSQTTDFENKDQLLMTAGVLETYMALEEYGDVEVWMARFTGQLRDAIKQDNADIDWSPDGEPSGNLGYQSGSPWTDPYSSVGDPLYGYYD